MPLYMDRHDIAGATSEAVAAAHQADLKIQSRHQCKSLTYWFDESRGAAFCLVEAPSEEAVREMHGEAHGLIPNEIIEVDPGAVEAFLGRIEDPSSVDKEPLEDSAFRTIMFTDIHESTQLTSELGDEAAMEVLRAHNSIVRSALKTNGGHEVKHTGDGIMASFSSVARAVQSAIEIQQAVARGSAEPWHSSLQIRIGLSAGEPVEEDDDLFGSSVQLAARLCDTADPGSIIVAHVVRDLCIGKKIPFQDRGEVALRGFTEPVRHHAVEWGHA